MLPPPTAVNLSKFDDFGNHKVSIPSSKNFVYFSGRSLYDCAIGDATDASGNCLMIIKLSNLHYFNCFF